MTYCIALTTPSAFLYTEVGNGSVRVFLSIDILIKLLHYYEITHLQYLSVLRYFFMILSSLMRCLRRKPWYLPPLDAEWRTAQAINLFYHKMRKFIKVIFWLYQLVMCLPVTWAGTGWYARICGENENKLFLATNSNLTSSTIHFDTLHVHHIFQDINWMQVTGRRYEKRTSA